MERGGVKNNQKLRDVIYGRTQSTLKAIISSNHRMLWISKQTFLQNI